jgi:hypothetical protein
MKLTELAIRVIESAEAEKVDFMTVGAIGAGTYGAPRSTRDVDVLVRVQVPHHLTALIQRLSAFVQFDPQVTFDTLNWGSRHAGTSLGSPPCKLELFETSDDPFVISEFASRREVFVPLLERTTRLPTP